MHRRKEAENINGRYVFCRNYQGNTIDAYKPQTTLICKKHGERINCVGCNICPKCGGRMYCENDAITHGMKNIIVSREMKCLACGLYTHERILVEKQREAKKKSTRIGHGQKPPPFCAVKGCEHRAWDKHTATIDTNSGPRQFMVCESHKRRMKTWKQHKDKGLDQIPIIHFLGELIDNPDYKYKKKGY